jgi:thiol:disulfide interchange protein DsbA
MNCETIDSILDEHRLRRLSPAERQDVAVHLSGCGRCAGGWAAHDALARDKVAGPPPELFTRVLGQLGAARAASGAMHRRRRLLAGAAAAVVAVVAVLAGYSALDRDAGADGAGTPAPVISSIPSVPRFVAGRDYEVLAAATPLAATSDGVPVTEFFMYQCFPCYSFEPELERFRTESLGRVALTRVPAVFNAVAELHARAFYTAEALGKLDAMHAAFYDEIHVHNNRLASRVALAEFFARFGVDATAFDAAFDSRVVEARVERALALSREYAIRATPSIVVAGRYSTNPSLAGPAMLGVVEQLVASETPCTTRCAGVDTQRPNAVRESARE